MQSLVFMEHKISRAMGSDLVALLYAPGGQMESRLKFIQLVFAYFLCTSLSGSTTLSTSPQLGIHPQDEKYYQSELIKCKDGSKSFNRDRLNDGFCDCVDGTDEPGTSACPDGRFYCRNVGSTPQILFSSRVNDKLCDCCDGSDEYDGSITCLNICSRDRDDPEMNENNISTRKTEVQDVLKQKKNIVDLEDLVQKLKELKIVVFLEVVFILMALRFLHRHIRSRRRRLH